MQTYIGNTSRKQPIDHENDTSVVKESEAKAFVYHPPSPNKSRHCASSNNFFASITSCIAMLASPVFACLRTKTCGRKNIVNKSAQVLISPSPTNFVGSHAFGDSPYLGELEFGKLEPGTISCFNRPTKRDKVKIDAKPISQVIASPATNWTGLPKMNEASSYICQALSPPSMAVPRDKFPDYPGCLMVSSPTNWLGLAKEKGAEKKQTIAAKQSETKETRQDASANKGDAFLPLQCRLPVSINHKPLLMVTDSSSMPETGSEAPMIPLRTLPSTKETSL